MSNEYFVIRGGHKKDDTLHRPILNNPVADKKAQQQSAAKARAMGIPNEVIRELYPLAT